MEVIFIIGATISFFMVFLVFKKKERSIADNILGAWLLFTGIYFVLLYLNLYIDGYKLLFNAGFLMPLLFGPVIFLYVSVMVNGKNRFKPIYWLHGLPFLLFNLYFFLNHYSSGFAENGIIFNINYEMVYLFKTYFYITGSSIYIVLSLYKLKKHKKNISKNFSYTEKIDLIWLNYVVKGAGVVVIVLLFTHLFDKYPSFLYTKLSYIIFTALIVYNFFLAYFGLKQQNIFTIKPPDKNKTDEFITTNSVNEKKRYKNSVLTEDESQKYLLQLKELFEKDKPHLDSELNLKETAAFLNISTNHLSQVINEQLNINFFEFVNNYRIKEAKSRLGDPKYKTLTLLAIAYDSGFNTNSSFNRVFKKTTGLTPSQYIKQKKNIRVQSP